MCGISGVWQYPIVGDVDAERLQSSGQLMTHRGPDSQGIFTEPGIGLVHTRLSLVDLNERSNQPFTDPTGQHALVFNGEIYNFRGLRDRLTGSGVAFNTTSDTEVLLNCLIHLGLDKTLAELEGMFAFAWYDQAEQRLTLARDRFGMKPLFFHDNGRAIYFASEVRALRPWVTMSPDHFSIAAWLQRGGPPTQGFTFYSGVQSLPPGTILTAERSQPPQQRRFFDLLQFHDSEHAESLRHTPKRQLIDQVDESLTNSVEMQLAADVPVGAFCSGGVDSSVVMAMATRQHKDLAIFHANVVGRHSELSAATELAEHLKLDLLSVDIQDTDFLRFLPHTTQHFGHPIAYREDSIPLFGVSHLVKHHGIRAVISGEGADELFLGYHGRIPGRFSGIKNLRLNRSLVRNIVKRILYGRNADLDKAPPKQHLAFGLLSRFEHDIEKMDRQLAGSKRDLSSIEMSTYHLRTLLHRNDSIGMSASIECRFPILDSNLARLAVNLPYNLKNRRTLRVNDWRRPFMKNKWILREVAARYVPPSLSNRPKLAFRTNAFARMNINADYLSKCSAADMLKLSRREIAFLADHGEQNLLVKLMQLSTWCDVCLHDGKPDDVGERLRANISIRPDSWEASTPMPATTSNPEISSVVKSSQPMPAGVR